MSDRFAQNRESRKHKVQRPREEGRQGGLSRLKWLWSGNRSGSASQRQWPQGTKAPGPLRFLGAEGQSASRAREPRDKEPADVEKDKGFQKQGVMPTKETTLGGQVWW